VIDNNLGIVDRKDANLLYQCTTIKDYKYLSKGSETIVLDKDNKEVAKLFISGSPLISGKKIYYKEGNSVFEIDQNEVFYGSSGFRM
jgi:hypothetical protein